MQGDRERSRVMRNINTVNRERERERERERGGIYHVLLADIHVYM